MSQTALYRLYEGEQLQYVGVSLNPSRRIAEHKCRAGWAKCTDKTVIDWYLTRTAALQAEAKAIAYEAPRFNVSQSIKGDATHAAVAGRIKSLRVETGMNQADFAKSLGVNVTQFNNWETGFRQPTVAVAIRICEAHDVTLDWLFRGVDQQRAAS